MSCCPENGTWCYSPQDESELSPGSIQSSCFLLLQGPSSRKSPSALGQHLTFSIQLGQIRLQSSIGSEKNVVFDPIGECNRILTSWIEKVLTVISWNWGPVKAETALDRSWRRLRLILRRGRSISNIFGSKAHMDMRTYLTVLFQRTANPTT